MIAKVQPQGVAEHLFALALLIKVLLIKNACTTQKLKLYETALFYKQLESGLNTQSCLYFEGFLGSKLFNGCLVV